jgi:hypothetical protein
LVQTGGEGKMVGPWKDPSMGGSEWCEEGPRHDMHARARMDVEHTHARMHTHACTPTHARTHTRDTHD